ncbi:MAG TPA: J domain-containing protein, partial [Verrucomicrobiae bacterium]
MDINTACRILGIESKASLEEIEAAKRNLLQALHPDKHSSDQKQIFEKMTRDVIEASQRLGTAVSLRGEKPRKDGKAILEKILFDDRFYSEKTDGSISKSKKLVKYDKRYD